MKTIKSTDSRFRTHHQMIKKCVCCNRPIKRGSFNEVSIGHNGQVLESVVIYDDEITLFSYDESQVKGFALMGSSCFKKFNR